MPYWDGMRKFETTELTLIDIWFLQEEKEILSFYFVELSNGEKGMMYFG